MFSLIRSGVTDLGKMMSPRWMCQRSTTWAGGFAGPAGDRLDRRVAEHLAARQRRPGLDRNLMLGAEPAYLVLGQVRVDLDLVDRRGISHSACSRRNWFGWK
jgi:hypothetical protein